MATLIPFPKIKTGYLRGVFWAIMICIVSVSNDVIMRYLGDRLHVLEISFFRFLFCMLTVIPFMVMMPQEKSYFFKTKAPGAHLVRGLIGAVALALCCYSVNIMPLSENTAIMFAQPLFFLPLAVVFLKEKVDAPRWIATLIGFGGLLLILHPGKEIFRLEAFVPITAAILFAISDIFNKKMIVKEHSLTLLFYFGLVTSLLSGFFVGSVWQSPTWQELGFLIVLGVGANLIQVCIFKAFSATDASSLMPFRYAEFPISALAGFLVFGQIPPMYLIFGAIIIACSSFYITYSETKKEKCENVYPLKNKKAS